MRGRYGEITKQVLIVLGVTGLVVIVAAAPGTVLAAKLFDGVLKDKGMGAPKGYNKKKAARSLNGLERAKLVKIKQRGGKFEIRLTKKGMKIVREIQLDKLQITKPIQWDGRWRVVIFDIPEESARHARDVLRAKFREWEFYPLQKSVWVCPWPCEKEIQAVVDLCGVARYVNIIIAENIVNDDSLRKHFSL